MFYTPRKSDAEKSPRSTLISPNKTEAAGPSPRTKDDVSKVRRSIREWEKGPGKTQTQSTSPVKTTSCIAAPLGSKLKIVTTQESKGVTRRPSVEAPGESQIQTQQKEQPKPADRVTLARNWLRRAKTQLNESRNLKSDLKAGITLAVEELYKLVKDEAEERKEKKGTIKKDRTYIKERLEKGTMTMDIEKGKDTSIIGAETIRMLEWQKEKIEATYTEMVKIRETVTAMQNNPPMQTRSYAETAATSKAKTHREPALHSVVIASRDNQDTGDQVLEQVRKAVNAKDGWVTVEKVRKMKDRKVIVGCRTKEEREKLKERLKSVEDHLHVEEVKNQEPMLVLRDVLLIHTDEDILKALRNQNEGAFRDLDTQEDRMEIRYRRKTRNPHTRHVVIRVSPVLYNRMLEKGRVHIDIQNVRVDDQSPLVQCSMCLGYGHGRRFCKETVPKCCHCGGLHLKDKCPDWISGAAPCCTNCTGAKLEETNHNAFSEKCPIRRRWEALAKRETAALYEARRGSSRTVLKDRETERVVSFTEAPHPAKQMNLQFACLSEQSEVDENNVQVVRIFTDGSKIEGKVGAALSLRTGAAETKTIKLSLSAYCTVYQAELLAICRATSEILKSGESSFGLYSDSRSALETITNHRNFNPLVMATRSNLREALGQSKVVSLFWVKAHAGLVENERVDCLAKEAALSSRRRHDYDQVPVSFVKRVIRDGSLDEWNRRYQSGETASVTKAFFPDARAAYRTVGRIKPKGQLTQVLTGHGGFSEYLNRFKCKESPSCVCDPDQPESLLHIVLECPAHGKERHDFEQSTGLKIEKSSLPDLISSKKHCKLFIEYLEKISVLVNKRNSS